MLLPNELLNLKLEPRFEGIISNQFFGHSHKDHFKLFYDTLSSLRPTSFGFISPSITPHTQVNLAYRVYYVDGEYDGSTRVRQRGEAVIFIFLISSSDELKLIPASP